MQYSFDTFLLDTERFEISQQGSVIHVEPQVIELLLYLIENPGRLVSKEELNQSVWGGRVVSDAALSSRIKLARQVLGDDGRRQQYIRTIHRKGFSFEANVEDCASKAGNHTISNIDSSYNGRYRKHNSGSGLSIIIMAFTSLSATPDHQYIADGITEDIVTTLSKISKLVVLTHPAILNPESIDKNSLDIARDLDVSYVLEGSVRSDGQRLRISVRLIETKSGRHIWADSYDREFRDIFELQDNVTKEVVSALQVRLTEGDEALLASRGTDNVEAWKLTFEAQASVLAHRQDSVRRGLEQLQRAVDMDKNYVLAWSTLGTAHWKESVSRGWSNSRAQSLELAVWASDQALTLEPDNASTLAARSLIFVSKGDFEEALSLAKKALHYANSEANTIAIASITLRACCEPEMAIQHTRQAIRLCPVYPAWYPYGIGICYWMLGRFDEAMASVKEAISIDPKLSLSYFILAMIYTEIGETQLTQEAVEKVRSIDPHFSTQAYVEGLPFKDEDLQARRARLLKKAGMPE